MLFLKKSDSIESLESMERIILSKGHGAAAFYALLNALGQNINLRITI